MQREDEQDEQAAVVPRDSGGRFLKGHSGNPAGRPPGTGDGLPALHHLIRRVAEVEGASTEEACEAVVRSVLRAAANGDMKAAALVWSRLPDAKAPSGVTVTTDASQAGYPMNPEYVAEVNRVLGALATPETVERVERMEAEREAALARLLA